MVFVSCITLLLLSTIVLADYYIDNANTSVLYSMSPSQSGKSWQKFVLNGETLYQPINNSTGNYSIFLDPTNCYDENYARELAPTCLQIHDIDLLVYHPGAICGTSDSQCFVQIPFTGSGITMYVFNAGVVGTTAIFSVDGGAAVSSSIPPPTTAENYQMTNVSLYDVQGLPSGNHTIRMTPIDWDPGAATDMKFDYAHVNETFVAVPSSTPTTTSTAQSSSQMSTASNRIDAGGIAAITLGVAAMLGGIAVIGILWFRKRRASYRRTSSSALELTYQIEPLTSEYLRSVTPSSRPHAHDNSFLSLQSDENSIVSPLMPSAFLRDAHAVGGSSRSIPIQTRPITSEATASLQPLLRHSADKDLFVSSSMSHIALASSDSAIASRYNLTPAQVETVRGLVADRVPADTIARVIEAFVSSRSSTDEANAGQVVLSSEYTCSMESPPSYKTLRHPGSRDR